MLAVAVLATGLWGGIDPKHAERLIAYHVNPLSQSAIPANMDTGDVLGDLYFFLQSPLLPLECANQTNTTNSSGFNPAGFDCNNPEKVDPNLMANKVVFEVDNRTTGYSGCNLCTNGTDPIGRKPCTIGEYVCDCFSFWQPITCDPTRLGVQNLSGSYSKRHHCNASSPNWDCWRGNVAKKTGGYWYSTLSEGQCSEDSSAPCGWKVVEEPIRIKKTCLDNAVFTVIEEAGPQCFQTCDGGKRNTTDPCWITCLYDTLLGPQAANSSVVKGMPLDPIVAAWEDSFVAGSRWNCVH
eukprot:Hpha_TRINITY_DN15018_c11_g4::TRINITY_DN15018_c11_g4_i1::g.124809::m.124809